MYCDFFGLRCRPFEDRPDTQFFYATGGCEEALAAMEYESRFGQGFALIVGEAGTGKTLLVRTLLQRMPPSDHVVVLNGRPGGQMDLTREVCRGFGVTLQASQNEARCLARLRRNLQRTRKAEHRSILMVDQVENLSVGDMRQLTTLTELQHDGERLLRVILVGQSRFRSLLNRPEFARFRQQLYGGRVLSAYTPAETEAYVRHRLKIAGAGDVDLFDKQALALMHVASGGIPRLINRLGNAAMLAAYGAGQTHIDRSMVADVVSVHGGFRLEKILAMWFFTVFSLRTSFPAISLLLSPSAANCSTWSSRWVSSP